MTADSCPACAQAATWYRRSPYGPGVDWFKCPGCNSEFLVPQPDDARLAEIYDADYYEPWEWENGAVVRRSKRRTFLRALSNVPVGPNTRLLDVGCAQGEFASAAVTLGGEVAGVDVNPAAIEAARGRVPEATFYCGELQPEVVGPGWDVITMFDFIEHVRDPLATLSAAASVLAPTGRLLISTPRVGSPAHQALGSHWPQYREEHLVLFSHAGMQAALSRAGLAQETVVSTVKYCTPAYLWGQAAAYSSPRVKSLARRSRALLRLPPAHWDLPLRFGEMTLTARAI